MTRVITVIVVVCCLTGCSSAPSIDPYLKMSVDLAKQAGQKIYDHFGDENEKETDSTEAK